MWAGSPVRAENVSGPTNRVAASVSTVATPAPLRGAGGRPAPPCTPRCRRRRRARHPAAGEEVATRPRAPRVAHVVDLPIGDLLEGDRAACSRKPVSASSSTRLTSALAELVVVRVDLALAWLPRCLEYFESGGEQVVQSSARSHERPSFFTRWLRASVASRFGGVPAASSNGAGCLDDSSDLRRCSFRSSFTMQRVEPLARCSAPIRRSRGGGSPTVLGLGAAASQAPLQLLHRRWLDEDRHGAEGPGHEIATRRRRPSRGPRHDRRRGGPR